jgi:PAS domain S-box-containing protein
MIIVAVYNFLKYAYRMEMKKENKLSKFNQHTTEIILESISDGVFTVDHNWKIMSFNRAAEEITGIAREEAIGKHCWDVFRSNMCEGECALKKTMKEGKSFVSSSTYIINSEKKRIPITVSTALLKDEQGNILGCVETFRDHSLVEELRKQLSAGYKMGDMISTSSEMKKIFSILHQVAESDSTILIEGETGTGKELMAKVIHNLSFRKDKPFVAINCGALPDTLLESELFGYKAGAFTNAVKDKPGYFAVAEGGTILLDEISDTSPAFQVRLLRVLEEQEFQPLGAVKKEKADVRIIAATNRDLSQMVNDEKFRQDLFYRINIMRIEIPPLRKRMEDVPILIDHFIDKLNRIRGKSISGIDQNALEILMSHKFPGNIRELENIIEHAFVLCSEGNILPRHFPKALTRQELSLPEESCSSSMDQLKTAEIKIITDALKKNSYNRTAAAKTLGMHKSTLFRKIDKLGIRLPKIDGRCRTQEEK